MQISVMIDLAIAAVFLLCAVLGAVRGLFRSLAELAILGVALLLSAQAAEHGTALVVEEWLRPAAQAAMERRVEELAMESESGAPLEALERLIDAIPHNAVRERAQALLNTLDLSALPSTREALLEAGERIVDAVLSSFGEQLVYTVFYILAFLLVTAVLRLVLRLVLPVFQLPLLRQVDQAGGLLLGAVKGALLAALGLWVLWRLEVLTPEIAEATVLLRMVLAWTGMAERPVSL